MVAEPDRVLERLEAECVLPQAGDREGARDGAVGDDEPFVADREQLLFGLDADGAAGRRRAPARGRRGGRSAGTSSAAGRRRAAARASPDAASGRSDAKSMKFSRLTIVDSRPRLPSRRATHAPANPPPRMSVPPRACRPDMVRVLPPVTSRPGRLWSESSRFCCTSTRVSCVFRAVRSPRVAGGSSSPPGWGGRAGRRPERACPERAWLSRRASMRLSSSSAPALSSMSLRLPHFGDWTHDGQPCSHGQPSIIRAVSAAQPSNAAKPALGDPDAARVAVVDEHRRPLRLRVDVRRQPADVPPVAHRPQRQQRDQRVLGSVQRSEQLRHPVQPVQLRRAPAGTRSPRSRTSTAAGRARRGRAPCRPVSTCAGRRRPARSPTRGRTTARVRAAARLAAAPRSRSSSPSSPACTSRP